MHGSGSQSAKPEAKVIVAAIAMIIASAYPLFQISREAILGYVADKRFQVAEIHEFAGPNRTKYGGHKVEITDSVQAGKREKEIGSADIIIDGAVRARTPPIQIRPAYSDSNRYHRWIAILKMRDRQSKTEDVVVIYRIDPHVTIKSLDEPPWSSDHIRFHAVLLNRSGQVRHEDFGIGERANPLHRKLLAQYVSPAPIGFHSDVLMHSPSLVFPIFYPFATAGAGLLLLWIGIARWRSRRRVTHARLLD